METGINFAPVEVSQYDIDALAAIRQNVRDLIRRAAAAYDSSTLKVLDIAPAEHGGAKEFFTKAEVKTLDIDYRSNPDYVADITKTNKNFLYTASFGLVVCTEVLEHTLNPFAAVSEISRILKPGGILVASAPYNFRTHGPLPDCWRFSELGWRSLLDRYDIQELKPLESDRPLFPLHYTIIAKKTGMDMNTEDEKIFKRFLVFSFSEYYPNGGLGDVILDTDSKEESVNFLKNTPTEYGYVFDRISGMCVFDKDDQSQ